MTDLFELKAKIRGSKSAERQSLAVSPEEFADGYSQLRAQAPKRSNPYLSPHRAGIPPTDALGRRAEERLAMALFNRGVLEIQGGGKLHLIDYQTPLKAIRSNRGVGKVDLIGVSEEGLVIVELKVANSREDRRIGLLEALIYAAILEENLGAIILELQARGHLVTRSSRPSIYLIAPRPYWSDTGYPPLGNFQSLVDRVATLLAIRIEMFELKIEGEVSLGLDGSKPETKGSVELIRAAERPSAKDPDIP